MKTVVMRTGAGIAIPLPEHVAQALGLRAGKKVRVEGPDAEGAIRIIPIPEEEFARSEPAPDLAPPSPADVARALSKSGPVSVEDEEVGGFTQELEQLVERHGETFREVEA